MAKQVSVVMVDDLENTQGRLVEADENVAFSLDGKHFEIDLSDENASRLRAALHPFIAGARRTARRTPGRRSVSTVRSDRTENQQIRAWALAQGMEVSERGRIPAVVVEAYRKAH